MIQPHGGKLVNRVVQHSAFSIQHLKKIYLNKREISDLEMIATGAFSPLEGFMKREDYESVLNNNRLSSSIVWTIPITLSVSEDVAENLKEGEDVLLVNCGLQIADCGLKKTNNAQHRTINDERILGILHLEERYKIDKEKEAMKVYGTTDEKHPGVAYLYSRGNILLGGKVSVFENSSQRSAVSGQFDGFEKYYFTPDQTRKIFEEKGWKTVVGFQTRNPIHRAHEYIQKCALEIVDGLFIHPIVGEVKEDDIPADIRMKCYEVLIENYYPKNRVLLCVNPAYMRYAGPKEAIFHAIVRKNYGCTHFIVGRDHAGVGNYYGSFDAQYIFNEFSQEELGITPLFFDNSFYCKKCGNMASSKTCPHSSNEHFSLSGTKVRELLKEGEIPPVEFTRPEVADILIKWYLKTN